jgi:uncharacterized membrane protein
MARNENVVVVSFDEPSKAYEALSVLKHAGDDGRIELNSASVVERTAEGELQVDENADNIGIVGTASGALLGMLIGVLGGPAGMVVGWSAGALMGGAVDIDRYETSGHALGQMATAIPAGSTAVLAYVIEPAVEVIDGEMARLGGTVTRRPVDEVLDELEAIEESNEAADREARHEAREQRKAEVSADVDKRIAALKDKLHVK